MQQVLSHPDAEVLLAELAEGRRRIEVRPRRPGLYVQGSPWVTRYPPDLIALVLAVKGPGYLCDEIAREEDPRYARVNLEVGILSYRDASDFAGARVLDFGCGNGASTMILARLLPGAEIVGVELVADSLRIARARAAHYGRLNLSFLESPSGTELPPGLGRFDAVVLNAVFEHLLPGERQPIMTLLWRALAPGGVLFLQETPNRLFPLELHTTGLPLINYLPGRLAAACARRFSGRVAADASWEDLLRAGIRGGTTREVLALLRAAGDGTPEVLRPVRAGRRDMADLWYATSLARHGASAAKRAMRLGFRTLRALTGADFVPELLLAIAKR